MLLPNHVAVSRVVPRLNVTLEDCSTSKLRQSHSEGIATAQMFISAFWRPPITCRAAHDVVLKVVSLLSAGCSLNPRGRSRSSSQRWGLVSSLGQGDSDPCLSGGLLYGTCSIIIPLWIPADGAAVRGKRMGDGEWECVPQPHSFTVSNPRGISSLRDQVRSRLQASVVFKSSRVLKKIPKVLVRSDGPVLIERCAVAAASGSIWLTQAGRSS